MSPFTDFRNRDLRQRQIIPAELLADCQALVVGVGAIGRQVALQLAAIGIPRLTLYDHDRVQVENLATQGYWPADLQMPKVEATARLCQHINPAIQVTPIAERFKRSTARTISAPGRLVLFLCVDSIAARKMIWETVRAQLSFFVDGRMSAEVVRVLASASPQEDSYYASTLFQPEEAYAGSCTARSTIYTANIAAGLMLAQFTRWLRSMPVDADLTLNLLASELTTRDQFIR